MTNHLKTLIRILSDGQFHSGEELGKALSLTRSAVWKLMQQFSAWDIEVESKTNKGYRVVGGLALLQSTPILQYMTPISSALIESIEILDEIGSTNDYLKKIPTTSRVARVCLAEKQTAGRGRQGRPWISPYARNIYLSILWPFQKDLSQLSGLSLAVAVAIVEALKDYGITENIGLKWPNDIFGQNKKLAGVLVELSGETYDQCNAVIGVGLNVDMPVSMHEIIDRSYTDIKTLTDSIPDRNQLAGLLLNRIVAALSLFNNQGFKPFVKPWRELDITFGKPVKILTPLKEIFGISRGIDENGFFLLEESNGVIISFSGGEVSLRLK
jgi:BirA family transcriptional regulator, biotin operon repressor / biotin---[acetyl-CoA-carboxylase] ligase